MKSLILNKLYILLICLSVIITGCSQDMGGFEKTGPEPEYRMFSLLDDYPALYDYFGSGLDQSLFNEYMAQGINPSMEEAARVMRRNMELIKMNMTEPSHPLTSSLTSVREIILRVLAQDEISEGVPLHYLRPVQPYSDSSELYLPDLFAYLDRVKQSESDTSDFMTSVFRKTITYLIDAHGGEDGDLEDVMESVIDNLKKTEGTNAGSLISLFQEDLGKMLLRANDDLWLDSEKKAVTDRSLIGENGQTNTGLGNTVRGVDSLLSGVNDIISKDPVARELFYDIIREAGKVMAVKDGERGMKDVLKKLICDIESNFTQGGVEYEEKVSNGFYRDDAEIYADAELQNTLKEAWPAIQRLFIKAGRPGSILADKPSNFSAEESGSFKKYEGSYIDYLTASLAGMNIDLKSLDIEKSLMMLLEYDVNCMKRTDPESSGMSVLEYAAVAMPVTNLFGYLDSGNGNDGSQNDGHGHGKQNFGSVTMTDALFNQAGKPKAGLVSSYDLTMKPSHGKRVFRSSKPFTSAEADDHRFYVHPDYPINAHMAGPSIGDGGIPNGGEGLFPSNKTINYWSDLQTLGLYDNNITYFPKNPTGIGCFNTGTETGGVIVRCCWEGEGPYYATEGAKVEGNVYTYYRPNGAIYCRVKKEDPDDASTWIYEYPVDRENSPIDAAERDDNDEVIRGSVTGADERANRYKDTWKSDYYMFKGQRKTDLIGLAHEDCFCVPGDTNTYPLSNTGLQAKCFSYNETIPEKSKQRECATQEEALFRNYQWTMYEKKIVHIMPLIMESETLSKILCEMFMISEVNGCVGLANARRHPDDSTGNGRWRLGESKKDTVNGLSEDDPRYNATQANGYRESRYPGDSRITIKMWSNSSLMDEQKAYEAIGKGGAMPDQIGVSFRPISRLAFVKNDKVLASEAGPDGPYWEDRNQLLPVLIAGMGTMHERNYYKSPDDPLNHDYNKPAKDDGTIKMPLLYMIDTVMPALVKPLFYFQKSSDDTPENCWKPRLYGNKNYLKPAAKTFDKYLKPGIENAEKYEIARDNYFEPMRPMASANEEEETTTDVEPPVRTLISYLVDSNYRQSDGLLPFMAKTKIAGKLFQFLQHVGADDGIYADRDGDDDDYTAWGTRRKIMYGLEQLMTGIAPSKGVVHENGYQLNFTHPDWLFAVDVEGSIKRRDEDVVLDRILEELIGSDVTGKGLAAFPDSRPEEKDWNNFYNLVNAFSALMGEDEKYSVTEEIIEMLDEKFNTCTPTDSELRAMRQTLGMIMTKYDSAEKKWEHPDEIKRIVTEYLPRILEVFRGNYNDFLVMGQGLAADDAFVEYLLGNFESSYSTEDILNQLCDFLDLDLIKNPNSKLWQDLAVLMEDGADMMDEKVSGSEPASRGFWPGYGSINEQNSNPYKTLGELLAK